MSSSPSPALLIAVPAAVVGVIVAAVLSAAGMPVLVALIVACALASLVAAVMGARANQVALRRLAALPVAPGEHPRLTNLVEGLCTTYGFVEPVVHVVDTEAVNAAAVGSMRTQSHLVVTTGALQILDRVELEAIITRELCELRLGRESPTMLVSLMRIPVVGSLTAPLVSRVASAEETARVDIDAVRLTRYPPALASALAKCAQSPSVDADIAIAHLWMCAPRYAVRARMVQPEISQRVDALGEI